MALIGQVRVVDLGELAKPANEPDSDLLDALGIDDDRMDRNSVRCETTCASQISSESADCQSFRLAPQPGFTAR